jgi:hypothetical protein
VKRGAAPVFAVLLLILGAAPVQRVVAQSPDPTYYMFDLHAGDSFPPNAPYTTWPPQALVIEGLGSAAYCTGLHYSQSQIETSAVSWINASYNVVIELSPQTVCGTLAQYESELSGITTYVEAHAHNPGFYWGGFMLDEEPLFGFSVASLKSLGTYTHDLMVGTPGGSWWFTEDQPTNWGGLANYNAIIWSSYPAPHAYNTNFVSAINSECSTYGKCENLGTIWSTTSSGADPAVDAVRKGQPASIRD